MKLSDYTRTLGGALQENKVSRYVLLGLVLSNIVLAMVAMTKKEVVVMVPPMQLGERSELAENQASSGLKESWGTYIAMLLGNVTPRTAPYLSQTLGKMFAPGAYKQMLDDITAQSQVIQDQELTTQFAPNQVFYLPAKDVVVVSGEFTMRGLRDAEQHMVRTYEIGVGVRDYMVRIDSVKVYEGPWNPNHDDLQQKAERQRREQAAKSNGAG